MNMNRNRNRWWLRYFDGDGDSGGAGGGTGGTGAGKGSETSGTGGDGDPAGDAGDGSEDAGDGKKGRAGGTEQLKTDLAGERKARQAAEQRAGQVDGILAAFKTALGMKDDGEEVTVETLAGKLADWEAKQEARETAQREKMVRTEVRAAAKAAGFHDANDALGRVDLSKFEVNEDGEVDTVAIEAAVKEVAEKSPYLVSTNDHGVGSSRDSGIGSSGKGTQPRTPQERIAAGLVATSKRR